jgi:hypothetical protein
MTEDAKLMCGIVVLTLPTVQYGGYFLLSVLSGKFTKVEFTDFQRAMFRAGHAHAGVIILLSLTAQFLADHAALPPSLVWLVRGGIPLSALLISGGFFFSASQAKATRPNRWIALLYLGAAILAFSLIILGIGLLR